MTVAQYLEATGLSLAALARNSHVSYVTLHQHLRHGHGLSVRTAKKLEAYSEGKMSAAEILGLTPAASSEPSSTAPRRDQTRAPAPAKGRAARPARRKGAA